MSAVNNYIHVLVYNSACTVYSVTECVDWAVCFDSGKAKGWNWVKCIHKLQLMLLQIGSSGKENIRTEEVHLFQPQLKVTNHGKVLFM